MIQIFHISDLHFGKTLLVNPKQYGEKVNDLLSDVHALMHDDKYKAAMKYLLITGDIVDGGEQKQYDDAQKALNKFISNPPPDFQSLLLVPGNHDYGALGDGYDVKAEERFEALANALNVPKPIPPPFTYQYRSKRPHVLILEDKNNVRVLAVGLNSCKKKGWSDFARGNIGEEQRDELSMILNKPDYSNCWKLVYLHHRPYDVKRKIIMELEDAEDLTKITEPIVDVIAYGHQGKMDKPDDDGPQPQPAPQMLQMQVVQMSSGNHKFYPLDANKSVKEQACYVITFDRPYDGNALKKPDLVSA